VFGELIRVVRKESIRAGQFASQPCGACHSRHFYGGLVHALSSNVRMGSYHDIGCVDNDALPRARYPRKTLRLYAGDLRGERV